MQGTIPYLGTFLTDLTMLDTALPDIVEVRKIFNYLLNVRVFPYVGTSVGGLTQLCTS